MGRQQLPVLELVKFGGLDQALVIRTILSAIAVGSAHREDLSFHQREGPNWLPGSAGLCFTWNAGKGASLPTSRFSHNCSRCDGDHQKTSCLPSGRVRWDPQCSVTREKKQLFRTLPGSFCVLNGCEVFDHASCDCNYYCLVRCALCL